MTTEPDLLAPETETPEAPEAPETPERTDIETPAPEPELDAAALADLVPETPDAYAITLAEGMEDIDADLNQRLHAAGFSNAQAQLVYDLAGEVLSPLLGDLDQAAQRATDRAALAAEFGGAGETGLRSEIRRKMNDPRYWRDRDPTLVAEVQADFARLSGG
ncbi:hypothetical protein [Thalassospira profundimaris]|uniref:hypothetical protein n=1 Tax=Thalassospira profundimaris TaxID=502049 RepID=UPI0002871AED|nr:hypothetical protein [Thalassospira profundimaris]EKF08351.1 hypothetical protein TH2_09539 [Thalassospira profundimaris WP0211]